MGPRVTEDGILIQAFLQVLQPVQPVHTIRDGKQTEMVCEDEAGFSLCASGKKIPSYTLIYWDGDGNQMEGLRSICLSDAVHRAGEQKQFENGICYSIYEKLGTPGQN